MAELENNDDYFLTNVISDWAWKEYEPIPFVDYDESVELPSHAWHREVVRWVDGGWINVTSWHFGVDLPEELDPRSAADRAAASLGYGEHSIGFDDANVGESNGDYTLVRLSGSGDDKDEDKGDQDREWDEDEGEGVDAL